MMLLEPPLMRIILSCLVFVSLSEQLCAQDSVSQFPSAHAPAELSGNSSWGQASWQPPLPGVQPESIEQFDLPILGEDDGIRAHKDGFFQKISLTGTWLDRGNRDDVGITEAQLYLATALPFPTRDKPLVITPGFDMRSFEGPLAPDLPETVYDAYLQFLWVPRWNEQWSAYLSVAPGIYSDFEQFDEDAIRVLGKAVGRYEMLPGTLELLLGVMYLDRSDYNVLPAGGIIWMPWDGARYEILFPQPKLAWRWAQDPGFWEDWFYVSGEFGGDTWLVERGTTVEEMIMRDLRAIMGLERRKEGGAGFRLEIGYVFARSFEFESELAEYEPDDTALVRLGVSY